MDHLEGWVLPVEPSQVGLHMLETITDEAFARDCVPDRLDYDVTDTHRVAYARFLANHGLEAGDLSQLVQAVYPLAASIANLQRLGV